MPVVRSSSKIIRICTQEFIKRIVTIGRYDNNAIKVLPQRQTCIVMKTCINDVTCASTDCVHASNVMLNLKQNLDKYLVKAGCR